MNPALTATFDTAFDTTDPEGCESVPLPVRSGTNAAPGVPPTNEGRKFAPEPLTPDEIRQLIAAASNRSNSGIRLRGLIGVLYGAGLRLDESLSLEPRDIDTAAATVRVREGKGRKDRLVGIGQFGCALVDRWIDRRAKLGLNGRHPVFACYSAGTVGAPLQQRYVRLALARLGRRAEIVKRVHPHGLRHSLASDMADRGVPTHVIQAQLGHSSLATTDRYVRRLRPMEVVEAMRGWDWQL